MVSFFFFFFLVLTEKKDLIADDTRDYKDEEPGPAMKRQPRPTRASIGLEKPDRSRRQSFPFFIDAMLLQQNMYAWYHKG